MCEKLIPEYSDVSGVAVSSTRTIYFT